MVHSGIQLPPSRNGSPAESSARRLRTRAPKSYVLPGLLIDEDELTGTLESNDRRVDRKSNQPISNSISSGPLQDHSLLLGSSNHSLNKYAARLSVTRQHRVPTPPPLPAPTMSYLPSKNFPAWLLGDALVKSSPDYLSQLSESRTGDSSFRPMQPTSPARGCSSSLHGNSPSKINKLHCSLSRHSSSTNRGLMRKSVGRSISPEGELESRREMFWEHYEYDSTVPHLQSKYFDKPLPTGEVWSDLDIQNVGIIPEPRQSSPSIHLFEVFAPTSADSTWATSSETDHHQEPGSRSSKVASPNPKVDSIPFGFNLLPSDYNEH